MAAETIPVQAGGDDPSSKDDHMPAAPSNHVIQKTVGFEGISMTSTEDGKDSAAAATPELPNKGIKEERDRDQDYKGYSGGLVGMPSKRDVWLWYLYDLCSYFIHNTLVPVLFPLIICNILKFPPAPAEKWGMTPKGVLCRTSQMGLYEALTSRSLSINNSKFSPLEWTAFSWGIGLILVAPILAYISTHLDHGRNQQIAAAATAIGAFFCLPTGFFTVTWIIPPYIAAIVAASTIASAVHMRQLGLMVLGFTGQTLPKPQFQLRRGVSSWFSLHATAAGSLGSAIISAFTYHMLRHPDGQLVRLWVVSIFSGLKWLVGASHFLVIKPGARTTSASTSSISHFFSIFKYPHALGSVMVSFLSSFTTMCIFTSVVLYLLGQLCFKPVFILYSWLIYFLLPLVTLPLMQPLQHLAKLNGVKMYLLGFLLSLVTTGIGFYYHARIWERKHVLVFAAIQSISVGVLHAFGRGLLIDCSPNGKEGTFSAWFSWMRTLGTCIGFAVASAIPAGNIGRALGVAFCTAISGSLLLVYGNISDSGGAMAAGHLIGEDVEEGSLGPGLDFDGGLLRKENGQKGTPERKKERGFVEYRS